jgi:FtsP/CotA-like multicopper oxidase with cupredoxin domain
MYETWLGMDVGMSALIALAWAVLSRRLGRLARHDDAARLVRAARGTTVWLVIAMVAVLAKVAMAVLLSQSGWEFAADRFLIIPVLYLAPAVLAFVWTVPVYWRVRRAGRTARAESVTVAVETRVELTSLKAALPPRLTAVGGVLTWWAAFVVPPVPPFGGEVLGYGFAFLLAGLLLVLKLRGESGRVLAGATVPSLGRRTLRSAAIVLGVLAVATGGIVWWQQTSVLPDRYSMAEHGVGGVHAGHGQSAPSGAPERSVTELTGPKTGVPDHRFTLTAQKTELRLPSGATVDGWTFNGTAPGPLLRARQGELVEVELVNKDVAAGVSLHWHGIDVPNAEDGVPGLTQDSVAAGASHVYRFRLPAAGSYWYHSHQLSSEQVRRGLYGGFIVDPPTGPPSATEVPVLLHTFDTTAGKVSYTIGDSDQLRREKIPAGTKVRLRLINTDSLIKRFTLTGTPFRIVAVDGTEVNQPTELSAVQLPVGGGGRFDLEYTQPNGPVRLAEKQRLDAGILLSPDGTGDRAPDTSGPEFDVTGYGARGTTPFDANSHFNVDQTLYLDNQAGFFDGKFALLWSINGEVFPNVPPITVREGDLVRLTFVNRSHLDHPMHLHGHHALVLARDGKPATGSPLWLDTVTVSPGETWTIAFRADNPGIWMDHCHNLDHAEIGMVMHLAYEGYTTPFVAGKGTPNQPE